MPAKKKTTAKSAAKKKAVTVPPKPVKTLIDVVNNIDAQTLARGAPLFGEVWMVEKRGMWLKGKAVLEYYPELEEYASQPSAGGRPKKGTGPAISFRSVSKEIGRAPDSIQKWLKLFLTIGKTEKLFLAWAKEGREAQEETWQRKRLAADTGKIKNQEPKINTKRLTNDTLRAVKKRARQGDWDPKDELYLVDEVDRLRVMIGKVYRCLLDDEYQKAVVMLEDALAAAEIEPDDYVEAIENKEPSDEDLEEIISEEDKSQESIADVDPGLDLVGIADER